MIIELLKNRVSVRKFKRKPVPEEVLLEILEAGRLSPSGGNDQPWVFGVIDDPQLIGQIAQIARHQDWIAAAPLLIVLCTVGVDDRKGGRNIQIERFPDYGRAIAELPQGFYWAINVEEHQTKIPGTHMLLAAQERGVGGCWVSRFDVNKLARLLNLPANYLPSEMLALGYPVQTRKPVEKKNLDTLVFRNVLEQP